MRVIALGGPGGMGRVAVRTAASFEFVDELIVADLDERAAEALAAQVGPPARAAGIDVLDGAALRALLSAADAVLNTTGPFFRFGVPILRAALDAGCHYLDICDDWEPTLEMLALSEEARAAGVTAVVGLGASPGISNLLAVRACAELDSVEDIVTGWGLGGTDAGEGEREAPGEPSAALVHWLHQCSGTIRILREGRMVDAAPVEERKLDYPGIGPSRAWTVGHPEAVTLPLWQPGLRDCANVMVGPEWLMQVVRALGREIDAGRLSPEAAARELLRPAPEPRESRPPEPARSGLPPLFALARGTRSGRPASAAAAVRGAPAGGMAGITSVPLALGLELMATGALATPGVFAPEQVVEPDPFFDSLAPRCSPAFADARALVAIST